MLHVGSARGQDCFVPSLFFSKFVEISIGFCVRRIDFVELSFSLDDLSQTLFHRFAHSLIGIEMWFLWQVANSDVGHRYGLAVEVPVHARHNPQQAGLS